jgi:hypothetical protein
MEATDQMSTASLNVIETSDSIADVPQLRLTMFEYVIEFGLAPVNILGAVLVLAF